MSTPIETTVKAYAKINLFLDITGILPNGYHSLNNIMQQIELHNEVKVTLSEGQGIKITCDNPQIPVGEKNIAYRAAELFLRKTGHSAAIAIDIKKNIPVMAGLGGSSTDGAAVLTALNRLFARPLSLEALEAAGAELGADVPFCIRGKAAFCKGIGERMTNIPDIEARAVVIVKPDFSCDTGKAYGLYDKTPIKSRGEPSGLLTALNERNQKKTAAELYNVFEKLYSDGRIERIKRELIASGASGAALSGSGSAVFGLFDSVEGALSALEMFKRDYPFAVVTKPVRNSISDLKG